MANVRFYSGTRAQYDSLVSRNPLALYFCDDTGELFKGDICLSDGIRIVPTRKDLPECSCAADGIVYFISETKSGFMVSPDRTEWLQTIYAPVTDAYTIPEEEMYTTVTTVGAVRDIEAKLYQRIEEVAAGGALSSLVPVDGTLVIADTADGGKSIGVAIAQDSSNALVAVNGGLFVPKTIVPTYTIEKVEAEVGFAASYRLKQTIGEEASYVGDAINITKDLVLKSATLEIVTEDDIPYVGAQIGDPYIKMVFNNAEASNLYIPVKGLVDTYTAGSGIEIIDNKISVKLANTTHGLVAVNGALSINLATKDSDGAMSKEDKRIIDAIPYVYEVRKYEITNAPIGALINYREDEIRIMCPADVTYTKQSVGTGGDANTYYVTLKAYAPNNDAVGYREHIGNQSDAEILTDIKIDQYGRRYQPTWLGIARFDEATGVWSYYGKNSSADKMIGWDYRIDWYNNNGIKIYTDSIRINLSNEDCHYNVASASVQAVATEVQSVKETVLTLEQSYTWLDM